MILQASNTLATSLIGASKCMRELRDLIVRIAPEGMPVLVLGETGTGKELVARALHSVSGRSGSLVSFNVAAISGTLFEDALFGHERGAFSGADRGTDGLIAEANEGTLFLDEISSLPVSLQPKLLRVLELGEYARVGSVSSRRSNFRLVAATNESITASVKAGRFRADLAYRLRGAVVRLPPLRDRLDDIPVLSRYFLTERKRLSCDLAEDAIRELRRHDWPGNVRELRYVLEQASVLAGFQALSRQHVRQAIDLLTESLVESPIMESQERDELHDLLAEHKTVERVAAILDRDVSTIYRRMRALGIDPPRRALLHGDYDSQSLGGARRI